MLPPGWRPTAFLAVVAIALASSPELAAQAVQVEGTVFIRLIGHVRVLRGDDQRVWREQLLDLREVEIGSGSGFIVSPQGWVVTNYHVINDEKQIVTVRGQKVEVSVNISRIEVVLPSGAPGQLERRYIASVLAADPELDVAVLNVSAPELPYLRLGDSDSLVLGDSVHAIGYPLGGLLELGKPTADVTPDASVSAGTLAAARTDLAGNRRYLQLTAPLHSGNSGGPVVDSEGYVVGVAQLRIAEATAIGFAIPINLVKQLLQKHGLDSRLPTSLLAMDTFIGSPAKGLGIRAPAGFEDRSPLRVRVDASSAVPATGHALALRIDRIATPESVEQVERVLLTDGTFERFIARGHPRRPPRRNEGGRKVVAGLATGTDPTTGDPLKLLYAIVDAGKEKIVARYVGAAETIAANQSLLQSSLADLEVSPLLTAEVTRAMQPQWGAAVRPEAGSFSVQTFDGWVTEPGLPWQCAAGLPHPPTGLALSPVGDFTVAFRIAWHRESMKDTAAVARSCSAQPGGLGATSYSARAAAWGMTYHIEGVFVPRPGGGVWQAEMIAPVEKSRFVASVFAEWIKAIER